VGHTTVLEAVAKEKIPSLSLPGMNCIPEAYICMLQIADMRETYKISRHNNPRQMKHVVQQLNSVVN
jgi:hypothetical protein